MILKQKKTIQKLVQIMKLKENQEKRPHRGIEPACITKIQCLRSGTDQLQT